MHRIYYKFVFSGKHGEKVLEENAFEICEDYHKANVDYSCIDCGAVILKGDDYTPLYYKPMTTSHILRLCSACYPLLDRKIRMLKREISEARENADGWNFKLTAAIDALAVRECELLKKII